MLRIVPTYGHRQGPARTKMINRTLDKLPHSRWCYVEKFCHFAFRRLDDESQHECQAGEIGKPTKIWLYDPILLFFLARRCEHFERLGNEGFSGLIVGQERGGSVEWSRIELRHRARECVFDELAICHQVPCQGREFFQVLEEQEAPRSV